MDADQPTHPPAPAFSHVYESSGPPVALADGRVVRGVMTSTVYDGKGRPVLPADEPAYRDVERKAGEDDEKHSG